MNLKEFAQEFIDSIKEAVEMDEKDYDLELTSAILEYITDSGEINAPEYCYFQKTRSRITAYDYNDEAESLDLFYLIKADTLLGKVNNNKVEKGFNFLASFYREAIDGTLLQSPNITVSDEISEIVSLIQSTIGQISQLRLYIITDGLTDPASIPYPAENEEQNIIIEFNVWDMQRVYQQHNLRIGKEKIEIDFPTSYNTEIQCLKMSEENPYIDAYLAIIPGETLAKIYKRYQQTLLEKNVRTFLQFKGKVNKGIRRTIREEPDMFFSYNNGISTTASQIEIKEKGRSLFITRLYNWQIVNGGQTTASIAAALNDKDVDLSRIFVPMKVSVTRQTETEAEVVKKISTYANSQTAIRNSDFSANENYLVDLEKYSRTEWIPNGNKRPICKWYFERTRGQYLDQLAQLSGFNEKTFRIEYPRQHKITKTDLAKYESAWNQRPFDVCRGAEKNYDLFIAEINRDKPVITPLYYKHMVAKCILFNEIDECVKTRKLGGHKSKMNAYILSSLSFLSDKQLNLSYIWEHQKVPNEVHEKIEELIEPTWSILTEGLKISGDWSKKAECWQRLKVVLGSKITKFSDNMLQPETNDDGSYLNETQQSRISEAESFTPDFWFNLAQWAKSNDQLTPIERKEAFNFGTMRSRNKSFKSLKQALTALSIVQKAREMGFNK